MIGKIKNLEGKIKSTQDASALARLRRSWPAGPKKNGDGIFFDWDVNGDLNGINHSHVWGENEWTWWFSHANLRYIHIIRSSNSSNTNPFGKVGGELCVSFSTGSSTSVAPGITRPMVETRTRSSRRVSTCLGFSPFVVRHVGMWGSILNRMGTLLLTHISPGVYSRFIPDVAMIRPEAKFPLFLLDEVPILVEHLGSWLIFSHSTGLICFKSAIICASNFRHFLLTYPLVIQHNHGKWLLYGFSY